MLVEEFKCCIQSDVKTFLDENQTHVEFAINKEHLFDRWCCSKKINKN